MPQRHYNPGAHDTPILGRPDHAANVRIQNLAPPPHTHTQFIDQLAGDPDRLVQR